jgi:aromatic amino acid aminotransferase I / 2-aminoadipate transaminase
MATKKRQEAIDLSHHFSEVSKARATSPLKGLQKYLNNPNLISLAGGEQDVSYQ